jgi:hypothetical protein
MTGQELVDRLARESTKRGELCHDGNIIRLLTSLTRQELSQLVTFGNVVGWHNEAIKDGD